MRQAARSTLILFVVALLVIAADLLSKTAVRQSLPLGAQVSIAPWLDNIFTLTHTRNLGAAFGMFPGLTGVFMVVALVVVVAIAVYFRKLAAHSLLLTITFGLQLGGAAGNLLDRLAHDGYVTDFLYLHFWPVFNVADSALVVGSVLLAWYVFFIEPRNAAARSQGSDPALTDACDPVTKA